MDKGIAERKSVGVRRLLNHVRILVIERGIIRLGTGIGVLAFRVYPARAGSLPKRPSGVGIGHRAADEAKIKAGKHVTQSRTVNIIPGKVPPRLAIDREGGV